MANVGKAASQFWQGAAGEVKDHNKNVQHSGEIGLAVGVGTGLAIAGAATLGILALPEVLVVGGVAVAAGAAISSLAGVYESSHSYTTGKDASPMKHAGAVATDMAVAATGGAVGAAVGAYGAMAAGELAVQSFMSGL
jgi:hypothetical protein